MNLRERTLGVGMRRRFQSRVDRLSLPTAPDDTAPVSEEDISTLPSTAQRYLRFMGVVGRPRDWSLRARFIGEFRQRPGQKFMPCEAWQYNTSPLARPHGSSSTSRAAWSTSAPPIAGQLSRAG